MTAAARSVVDVPSTLRLVGRIVAGLGLTLVVPLGVAAWYGESVRPFALSIPIVVGAGLAIALAGRGAAPLRARDGFLAVVLLWAAAPCAGALPYILEGGDISSPVEALFEATAGFTATGSTAMTSIGSHGRGILFWRSMTQWIGGVGIIGLVLVVLPRLAVGGRQLMQREVPGPQFERLAPHLRDTARRIWGVYLGLTVAAIAALAVLGATGLAPGMDLYNAVAHAFTVVSAGGFSPEPRSIEAFGPWAQWVLLFFIVAAGTNFVLWYRAFARSFRHVRRDEELRWYLGILGLAGAVVATELLLSGTEGVHGAIRHGLFNVASVMTGTGFASTDFALWPQLAIGTLIPLMLVGGCAGSPTGALKVMRLMIITRLVRREVRVVIHPQAVDHVRVSGRVLGEPVVRAAAAYVLVYVMILVAATFVLLLDAARRPYVELDVVEALTASAATLGNVGPGLGYVGPMGSFSGFSDISTLTMTVLMWAGRLELIPVLVVFSRAYWRV